MLRAIDFDQNQDPLEVLEGRRREICQDDVQENFLMEGEESNSVLFCLGHPLNLINSILKVGTTSLALRRVEKAEHADDGLHDGMNCESMNSKSET